MYSNKIKIIDKIKEKHWFVIEPDDEGKEVIELKYLELLRPYIDFVNLLRAQWAFNDTDFIWNDEKDWHKYHKLFTQIINGEKEYA